MSRSRPPGRRGAATLLAAAALAAGAGCGGGGDGDGRAVPGPPTGTAPTAGVAPAPAPAGLEARLPDEDALRGLGPGRVRELPTPAALVDALYQDGDPSRAVAERRLAAAGYRAGLVRDQSGADPGRGALLMRAYVMRLRDAAAARAEVDASVDEVREASSAPAADVPVPDVPDARALRVELAGAAGGVVFVAFPAGPYVHGLQAAARTLGALPQDEVLAAAGRLYERVGAGR